MATSFCRHHRETVARFHYTRKHFSPLSSYSSSSTSSSASLATCFSSSSSSSSSSSPLLASWNERGSRYLFESCPWLEYPARTSYENTWTRLPWIDNRRCANTFAWCAPNCGVFIAVFIAWMSDSAVWWFYAKVGEWLWILMDHLNRAWHTFPSDRNYGNIRVVYSVWRIFND